MDKLTREFQPAPVSGLESQEENHGAAGRRLVEAGDHAGAVEEFKRLVERRPEDFFAFNAIGVCFKNMGDNEKALRNFERALEFADLPKDQAKTLANIGNLYFSRGNLQAALGHYKEASSLWESNPLYLALIARTFMALGDPERAQRVLTGVSDLKSEKDYGDTQEEKARADYLMAVCWAGLGEEAEALKRLELALRSDPKKMSEKLERDRRDEKSLLYTLAEEPAFKALAEKYEVTRTAFDRLPGK